MDVSMYHKFAAVESVHWWFQGRRRVVADVLRGYLADSPRVGDLRVLDVGSGTGEMVGMLREFGSVTAMDDSAHAVAYCRRRHAGAVTVRTGRVPDDLRDGEVFDLVTAFDVIEHIEDDVAALRGLVAALEPGGRLVLTVPAYQLLWSRHDVNNGHHRRYRRGQLADVLRRAGGVRIDRIAYFNWLLFPPVLAVRLFDRLRQRVAPTADGGVDAHLDSPPAPVNRVLRSVFASEATLQRYVDPPFGVSLIALCRAV